MLTEKPSPEYERLHGNPSNRITNVTRIHPVGNTNVNALFTRNVQTSVPPVFRILQALSKTSEKSGDRSPFFTL